MKTNNKNTTIIIILLFSKQKNLIFNQNHKYMINYDDRYIFFVFSGFVIYIYIIFSS